jgi:myo-inositol-1(or 4)-monophosphatase
MPAPSQSILDLVSRARGVVEDALDGVRERLLATMGRVEVETKGDGTPVSSIDLEVDAVLARAITAAFPSHAILSEERDTVAPAGEWAWIVDPIDGTSNFIAGLPYWCVSVALTHEGSVALGVVDAPAVGRRYVAIRGRGAHRDGRRLQVRRPVDARDARYAHVPVMLTTGTARRAHTAGIRLNPRVMGSTALDLAVVAEGSAVASVAVRPHVWDIAAGSLLVTEAGGEAVHLRGDPLLPLRPDVDHRDLTVPFAAAAERAYVEDLASGLLPGG